MNEFKSLREWLSTQSLTPVAQATGVNRRTLQRIVTEDDYLVKVDKYLVLKDFMDRSRAATETEHAV